MGGFFGAASKNDCVTDVFFGTDYHSHLGTRRGGMTSYSEENGFQRNIQFRHMIRNKQTPVHGKAHEDRLRRSYHIVRISCAFIKNAHIFYRLSL